MYVDWENPPYKGSWLEIGPARREGMNQNTPNPRVTLRRPILRSSTIEWGVEAVPRMLTFYNRWYWTPRSGCPHSWRRWSSHLLAEALCLISEKSAGQKLWEELENQTNSRYRQNDTRRIKQGSCHSNSHMIESLRFHVALRDFLLRRSPFNLILCIITFIHMRFIKYWIK